MIRKGWKRNEGGWWTRRGDHLMEVIRRDDGHWLARLNRGFIEYPDDRKYNRAIRFTSIREAQEALIEAAAQEDRNVRNARAYLNANPR
jgi:hypothetical protein